MIVLAQLSLSSPAKADSYVFGDGTQASCTWSNFSPWYENLKNSVLNDLRISFNCGGPATLYVERAIEPEANYTEIDGGGLITLDGRGQNRLVEHREWNFVLKNISLTNGSAFSTNSNLVDVNGSGGAILSEQASNAKPASLTLINVTISNSKSLHSQVSFTVPPTFDNGGGGLYARNEPVTIINSRFTGNETQMSGGGAHFRSANVTIQGSTFDSNSSGDLGFGGAIHMDGGPIKLTSTIFQNNIANNQGGAVYLYLYGWKGETFEIVGSVFSGNIVVSNPGKIYWPEDKTYMAAGTNFGGGLAIDGSGDQAVPYASGIIRNSSFVNNSAGQVGYGGGISLTKTRSVTIDTITISGNTANKDPNFNYIGGGGGIYSSGSTDSFVVMNSTITENQSGYDGGGIQHNSEIGTLSNTIVANNVSARTIGSQCYRPSNDFVAFQEGKGNFQYPTAVTTRDVYCSPLVETVDPQLGPLVTNTAFPPYHIPADNSPVIDAGVCTATRIDQRGYPRPLGKGCDSGAVENGIPDFLYLPNIFR